jgi:hypothetical protein
VSFDVGRNHRFVADFPEFTGLHVWFNKGSICPKLGLPSDFPRTANKFQKRISKMMMSIKTTLQKTRAIISTSGFSALGFSIFVLSLLALSALVLAQTASTASSPHVTPAAAKDHIGEVATVCGKVVDNQVSKYGLGGRGKPVTFDLDQPQPNQQFYFVAFGAHPDGPSEAIAAYQGKRVCVTGKIASAASGPYILAADRSQIKVESADK